MRKNLRLTTTTERGPVTPHITHYWAPEQTTTDWPKVVVTPEINFLVTVAQSGVNCEG